MPYIYRVPAMATPAAKRQLLEQFRAQEDHHRRSENRKRTSWQRMESLDELLGAIFAALGADDLVRAGAACRRWRRLANDEDLWRGFCSRKRMLVMLKTCPACTQSWKQVHAVLKVRVLRRFMLTYICT